MLGSEGIRLEFEKPDKPERDKYGRLLAYVFADGRNVNVEMVRKGHSKFWTKYVDGRYAEEFRVAAKEADTKDEVVKSPWKENESQQRIPFVKSAEEAADLILQTFIDINDSRQGKVKPVLIGENEQVYIFELRWLSDPKAEGERIVVGKLTGTIIN